MNLFEEKTGVNPLEYYKDEINWMKEDGLIEINKNYLEVTTKGRALIIDIQRAFETKNNLSYTQPQYDILDMFEGKRETYDLEVIEKDDAE